MVRTARGETTCARRTQQSTLCEPLPALFPLKSCHDFTAILHCSCVVYMPGTSTRTPTLTLGASGEVAPRAVRDGRERVYEGDDHVEVVWVFDVFELGEGEGVGVAVVSIRRRRTFSEFSAVAVPRIVQCAGNGRVGLLAR